MLIYFIGLKREMTVAQKIQLLGAVEELQGGDADDMLGFSLKEWLEEDLGAG